MPKNDQPEDGIDWSLTTWEGSRREQLRRWAALPLERIVLAIEEMADLARRFEEMRARGEFRSASAEATPAQPAQSAHEPSPPYDADK